MSLSETDTVLSETDTVSCASTTPTSVGSDHGSDHKDAAHGLTPGAVADWALTVEPTIEPTFAWDSEEVTNVLTGYDQFCALRTMIQSVENGIFTLKDAQDKIGQTMTQLGIDETMPDVLALRQGSAGRAFTQALAKHIAAGASVFDLLGSCRTDGCMTRSQIDGIRSSMVQSERELRRAWTAYENDIEKARAALKVLYHSIKTKRKEESAAPKSSQSSTTLSTAATSVANSTTQG
ncbi:hypothetical protein BD324DRAFT_647388 [Kockovaella imperatae]|uniref:Uncharacterized protein n=1 Tax=Kockovaella imperatae TaxID=4999 RepID=A0A1Y1UTD4_9TREE|nr:hypothetical protein BD324DRAFT_647388 [Kockovaella imperatae]ORX40455.1 hypothetical protein BD324DRAFT_647388 [Kockovaella imperatae]